MAYYKVSLSEPVQVPYIGSLEFLDPFFFANGEGKVTIFDFPLVGLSYNQGNMLTINLDSLTGLTLKLEIELPVMQPHKLV